MAATACLILAWLCGLRDSSYSFFATPASMADLMIFMPPTYPRPPGLRPGGQGHTEVLEQPVGGVAVLEQAEALPEGAVRRGVPLPHPGQVEERRCEPLGGLRDRKST